MMKPVFYANDNGKGMYTGLAPLSEQEYANTIALHRKTGEDSTDFLSRVFYLWVNHNSVNSQDYSGDAS